MKNKRSNIGDVCNLSQQFEDEKKSSKFTCIPIGLTQGQFNVNSFSVPEKLKSIQMLSACLFAFCYIYFKDPLMWTTEIINDIIQQGSELVKHNNIDLKDRGIINCIINAQSYKAKIQIQEPTLFDTIISTRSIYTSLDIFFQANDYGLFRCSKLCYLIWKSNQIYFVFDGQGRSYSCNLDENNGFASLICTEMLTDVSKLIKKLSGLTSDDCYSISSIKMKYFRVGLNGCVTPVIQFTSRECNTYTIVNPHWAILRGNIHIGSCGFKSIRNRQSMTTNLIALVCNEMQSSNSWNGEFVDKIILLGNKLFRDCDSKLLGEMTVHQLPRQYYIRDYKCEINYRPYDHSGKLTYSDDVKNTDLFIKLSEAFERTSKSRYYSSVLIQVNTVVFAVWRNNGLHYLFDAYARNDEGGVADDRFGKPCVHMHSTLESLCSVLSTNLTTIAENEKFVLHGINLMFECICGEQLDHNDVSLLTELIDDLCWPEMTRFQEMSYHKETVYNLDESGDDDIFNGTVDRTEILPRSLSYVSTVSRETNSSFAAVSVVSSIKSVKSFTLNSREHSKRNSAEYLSVASSITGSKKSISIQESVISKATLNSGNTNKSIESRSRNGSVISVNSTSTNSKKDLNQFNESKTSLTMTMEHKESVTSLNSTSTNPRKHVNQFNEPKTSLTMEHKESVTSINSTSTNSKKYVNQFNESKTSLIIKQKEPAKFRSRNESVTSMVSNGNLNHLKQSKASPEMKQNDTSEAKTKRDNESIGSEGTSVVKHGSREQLITSKKATEIKQEMDDNSKYFMKTIEVKQDTNNQGYSARLKPSKASTKINLEHVNGQLNKFEKEIQIKQETKYQAEPAELTEFSQSNPIKLEEAFKNRRIEKFKHHMKEGRTEIDGITHPTFDIAKQKNDRQVVNQSDDFQKNYRAIVETTSTETNICVLMWELKQEIKRLMQTTEKYENVGKGLL